MQLIFFKIYSLQINIITIIYKMKQALNLILALTFHVMVVHAQVNWQSGAGGVQWAFACDFVNHDMGSAKVSGDQCGNKCMSTSGCTHFAWTPGNPGTCWMKSGSVQKSDAKFNNNYQMVCGITQSSSQGINWQSGAGGVQWAFSCDFVNHDMGSAQVPGEQCGGKCMSTSGCTHFSWTPGNPGSCWMKYGSVQKSDAKLNNNNRMICGITPSSNPNPGPNGDGGISEADFLFFNQIFLFLTRMLPYQMG
jgi:hypothetical protein